MPKIHAVLKQLSDRDISYEIHNGYIYIPDYNEPEYVINVDEKGIHLSLDGVDFITYNEATFGEWLDI